MMVIMVIRTTITEVSIGLQKIFKETTSIKIYCIHSMYLRLLEKLQEMMQKIELKQ